MNHKVSLSLYNQVKENQMLLSTTQGIVSRWKYKPDDEEILESLLALNLRRAM